MYQVKLEKMGDTEVLFSVEDTEGQPVGTVEVYIESNHYVDQQALSDLVIALEKLGEIGVKFTYSQIHHKPTNDRGIVLSYGDLLQSILPNGK